MSDDIDEGASIQNSSRSMAPKTVQNFKNTFDLKNQANSFSEFEAELSEGSDIDVKIPNAVGSQSFIEMQSKF